MSVDSNLPAGALPPPEPEAAAHGERVVAALRAAIAGAGGALPFIRFMDLALYAPGLGYYSAGSRKFGEKGDFVTAPEISPLFSQCMARQCRDVLAALGGGDILEIGAGTGRMAADGLAELERLDALPNRYEILEVSAELRERQRETLAARVPHLVDRVVWLDGLPEPGFRGVVVANEVLDAMPVHRFRVTAAGLCELGVRVAEGGFQWCELPLTSSGLKDALEQLQAGLVGPWPAGYESEANPALAPWIAGLAERLSAGLILLIDYGFPRREFYHPDRRGGTLMCHYRHRAHADPLILAGLQDITAHVDFTAVAEAALAADLSVCGYTTQAHFLLGAGIDALLSDAGLSAEQRLVLAQGAKKLLLPSEMGELFKVIGLCRGLEQLRLSGFALRDLRHKL